MNANELRIGNLVECKGWGDTYTDRKPYYGECIFPVFSACKDFVKLEVGHDALQKVKIEEVKPIPFTIKWVIDFRFVPFRLGNYYQSFEKEDTYQHNYEKDRLIITEVSLPGDKHWYEFQFPSSELNSYNTVKIKFVHQLQNLYFTLTGEELTISK